MSKLRKLLPVIVLLSFTGPWWGTLFRTASSSIAASQREEMKLSRELVEKLMKEGQISYEVVSDNELRFRLHLKYTWDPNETPKSGIERSIFCSPPEIIHHIRNWTEQQGFRYPLKEKDRGYWRYMKYEYTSVEYDFQRTLTGPAISGITDEEIGKLNRRPRWENRFRAHVFRRNERDRNSITVKCHCKTPGSYLSDVSDCYLNTNGDFLRSLPSNDLTQGEDEYWMELGIVVSPQT